MNTQKQGPGCGCSLIALLLFLLGGPVLLYIAPSVERYPNLPDDGQQIQQLIQHWHGPSLPKIKAPTGDVFTVSTKG
jgi:hypothetical protein